MLPGSMSRFHFVNCFRKQRHTVAILCTRLNSTNALDFEAALNPERLLSNETKDHVLNCMRTAPPVGLRLGKTDKERINAAVLILLCTPKSSEADKNVSILYTRRSLRLSRHVRQVSFPGGLQDHTDTDYIDCALRETEEEIGLPRSRVEVWGTGALIRPPLTAAIMPVFGVVRELDISTLKLNEDEVEDAFTVSIRDLAMPGILKHTQFKSGFSSPVFVVKPFSIWGITGFLTNTFLRCLLPKGHYNSQIKYLKPHQTEKPQFQ